jgi:hypothetical protein
VTRSSRKGPGQIAEVARKQQTRGRAHQSLRLFPFQPKAGAVVPNLTHRLRAGIASMQSLNWDFREVRTPVQFVERLLKPLRRPLVAPADARENPDATYRYGVKSVRVARRWENDACRAVVAAPRCPQHETPPLLIGQWHEQLPSRCETIKPQRRGVRRASEHDDDIDLAGIVGSPVTMYDINLMPWTEADARSRRQFFITFDRDHAAIRTDDLGEDGGVIARARADLHDAPISLKIEVVEIACPEAGHAIVELPGRVDRHEDVVVDPCGSSLSVRKASCGYARMLQRPGPRKRSRATDANAPTMDMFRRTGALSLKSSAYQQR